MIACSRPSIAILFATMNPAAMLLERLGSCASQNESPDLLAIIEVGSTEGRLDVLREFGSLVRYTVSKPDKGVFDAPGKGLGHVRPDGHVFVLGSDDRLYDDLLLADARRRVVINPGHEVYYGRVEMVEADGRETTTRASRRRTLGETSSAVIFSGCRIRRFFEKPIHSFGLAASTPDFKFAATMTCCIAGYRLGHRPSGLTDSSRACVAGASAPKKVRRLA